MAYDAEEMALREKLIEFSPKMQRLIDIQNILSESESQFRRWQAAKFATEIAEQQALNEEFNALHDWFNEETARLYNAGYRGLFDKSVQPRPLIRVRYESEEEFLAWAKDYSDAWIIDKRVEAQRNAAAFIWDQGKTGLLRVDLEAAKKVALSAYDEFPEPIYEGPFTYETEISKTSPEKLIKLVVTFGIEQSFDDRQALENPDVGYDDSNQEG